MIELGSYSQQIALFATALAGFLAVAGAWSRRAELVEAARRGVLVASGFLTLAVAGLLYAFVIGDYQLNYVWANSDSHLPLFYKIGALWGGQAGSLLFWAWLLSALTVAVVIRHRGDDGEWVAPAIATLMIVQGFFLTLVCFVSDPFSRADAIPLDGRGLNPLLQHPLMTIHPPALYFGFVGMTVPFAFAVAALVSGQLGEAWLKRVRAWTILAWLLLTAGNVLGARWAYVELGWGGYWAWDPVENAAFIPWLAITAFLHSVMVQERKGMLKVWNMLLVITAFLLTILGTFITRSGVVSSVHSFAHSAIGLWFAGFLFFLTVSSLGILFWRSPLLGSENTLDSFVSREAAYLLNNLILLGGAFTVLLGTFFPIISETVRGVKISLGPPYFNAIMTPIGLGLLLLTGVGPLVAWKRMRLRDLLRAVRIPLFLGLVAAAILFLFGVRGAIPLATLGLAMFVLITIVGEFARGVRARRKSSGESVAIALGRLFRRSPRRYGGYVVHLGVVLVFVGFAGTAFNREYEETLKPGEALCAGDYELTFRNLEESAAGSTETILANVVVSRGGRDLALLRPHRNYYPKVDQVSTEVAIYSTWSNDLYVVFAGADDEGGASFKVYLNPLVGCFWWGGIVICLGGVLVLSLGRRRVKD